MYRFIYDKDYKRIIPAVITDSRANIPSIATVSGSVLKNFIDAEIQLVSDYDNRICYKIETENGNLVGYFIIDINLTNQSAYVFKVQLRPAFVQFDIQINNEINNFMFNFTWKKDFLFK